MFKSKWAAFTANDIVLDYGGGKFGLVAEYMNGKVKEFHTVDKFNRCEKWNTFHTTEAVKHGVNVVTCANVLNVIKENEIVDEVIETVYKLTTDRAVFCVYEGDKTGNGRKTQRSSWQRNERTTLYAERIARVFPNVQRHGNIIIASK